MATNRRARAPVNILRVRARYRSRAKSRKSAPAWYSWVGWRMFCARAGSAGSYSGVPEIAAAAGSVKQTPHGSPGDWRP